MSTLDRLLDFMRHAVPIDASGAIPITIDHRMAVEAIEDVKALRAVTQSMAEQNAKLLAEVAGVRGRMEEYRREWDSACSRERSTFAELKDRREEVRTLGRELEGAQFYAAKVRAEWGKMKAELAEARAERDRLAARLASAEECDKAHVRDVLAAEDTAEKLRGALRAMDGWLRETGHASDHPWRLSLARALSADPPASDECRAFVERFVALADRMRNEFEQGDWRAVLHLVTDLVSAARAALSGPAAPLTASEAPPCDDEGCFNPEHARAAQARAAAPKVEDPPGDPFPTFESFVLRWAPPAAGDQFKAEAWALFTRNRARIAALEGLALAVSRMPAQARSPALNAALAALDAPASPEPKKGTP